MLARHLALLSFVAGCTGASWGENTPGGDTYVDPDHTEDGAHRMGAIAVESDEDQLWVVHEEGLDALSTAHLSAIDPVTGASTEVLDVSNTTDRRVVFPAPDRMILMAQQTGQDTLALIDTSTRQVISRVTKDTWYWGTRTAPSGRSLVVADNDDPAAPLHVVDTRTLEHQVISHGGDSIEAMWNHNSDILLALSATHPHDGAATARVMRYDLRTADPAQPVPAPTQTWDLTGYGWDFFFSYTWISISPDDRWAVFPMIDQRPNPALGAHVLFVLDQQTGQTAIVPGMGPVGFTRDSHAIVTYGPRDGGGQDLWLIDPVTHARKIVTMPFVGSIMFHPVRDADYIVCSPVSGSGAPAVYDVAHDVVHPLAISTLGLYDFVTRPGHDELWLETAGSVFALSLPTATLTWVDLRGAIASTINVRPTADQAVVGDAQSATIQRFAMATGTRVGTVTHLPSPLTTTPIDGALMPRLVGPGESYAQSPFDPAYQVARAPSPHRAGRFDPAPWHSTVSER